MLSHTNAAESHTRTMVQCLFPRRVLSKAIDYSSKTPLHPTPPNADAKLSFSSSTNILDHIVSTKIAPVSSQSQSAVYTGSRDGKGAAAAAARPGDEDSSPYDTTNPLQICIPSAISIKFRRPCVPCLILVHHEGTSPHVFDLKMEFVFHKGEKSQQQEAQKSEHHTFSYSKFASFPHKSTSFQLFSLDQRHYRKLTEISQEQWKSDETLQRKMPFVSEVLLTGDFDTINVEMWGIPNSPNASLSSSDNTILPAFKLHDFDRKDVKELGIRKIFQTWYGKHIYGAGGSKPRFDKLFSAHFPQIVEQQKKFAEDDPRNIFHFKFLHSKIQSLNRYTMYNVMNPHLLSRVSCFYVLQILSQWDRISSHHDFSSREMDVLIAIMERDMFADDTDVALGYEQDYPYAPFDMIFFLKLRLEHQLRNWVIYSESSAGAIPGHKIVSVIKVMRLLVLALHLEPMAFQDSKKLLANVIRILYAKTGRQHIPEIVVQHALILLMKLIEMPSTFYLLQSWKPEKKSPLNEKNLAEFISNMRIKFQKVPTAPSDANISNNSLTVQLLDVLEKRRSFLEKLCPQFNPISDNSLTSIISYLHNEPYIHINEKFFTCNYLNQQYSNEFFPFVTPGAYTGQVYPFFPHLTPLNFLFVAQFAQFFQALCKANVDAPHNRSLFNALLAEMLRSPHGMNCVVINFHSLLSTLLIHHHQEMILTGEILQLPQMENNEKAIEQNKSLLEGLHFADFRPLHALCGDRYTSAEYLLQSDKITTLHMIHLLYAHVSSLSIMDACFSGKNPLVLMQFLHTLSTIPIVKGAIIHSLLIYSRGNLFLKVLKSSLQDKALEHECLSLIKELLIGPRTFNQQTFLLRFVNNSLSTTLQSLLFYHPESQRIAQICDSVSQHLVGKSINTDLLLHQLLEVLHGAQQRIIAGHTDRVLNQLFVLESLSQYEEYAVLLLEDVDIMERFISECTEYLGVHVLQRPVPRAEVVSLLETVQKCLVSLLSVVYNLIYAARLGAGETMDDLNYTNLLLQLIRTFEVIVSLPGFSFVSQGSQLDKPQSTSTIFQCRRTILNIIHLICSGKPESYFTATNKPTTETKTSHIFTLICDCYEKNPRHCLAYTELLNDLLTDVFWPCNMPHLHECEVRLVSMSSYKDQWKQLLDDDTRFLNVMRSLSKEDNVVVHQALLNVYHNICKISPRFIQKYIQKVVTLCHRLQSRMPVNPLIVRTLNMCSQLLRQPAFIIVAHREGLLSCLITLLSARIPLVAEPDRHLDGCLMDILTESIVCFFECEPLWLPRSTPQKSSQPNASAASLQQGPANDASTSVQKMDTTEPPTEELFNFFSTLSALLNPENLHTFQFLCRFAADLLKKMTSRCNQCALLMMELSRNVSCNVQVKYLFQAIFAQLDTAVEALGVDFTAQNLAACQHALQTLLELTDVAQNMLLAVIQYDENMRKKAAKATETVHQYVKEIQDAISKQNNVFEVKKLANYSHRDKIESSFKRVIDLITNIGKLQFKIQVADEDNTGKIVSNIELDSLWKRLQESMVEECDGQWKWKLSTSGMENGEKSGESSPSISTTSGHSFFTMRAPQLIPEQRPIYNESIYIEIPSFIVESLQEQFKEFQLRKLQKMASSDRHKITAKKNVRRFEERYSATRKKHTGVHVDEYKR